MKSNIISFGALALISISVPTYAATYTGSTRADMALSTIAKPYKTFTTEPAISIETDNKSQLSLININGDNDYIGSILEQESTTSESGVAYLLKSPKYNSSKYYYKYIPELSRFIDMSSKIDSSKSTLELPYNTDSPYLLLKSKLSDDLLITNGWNTIDGFTYYIDNDTIKYGWVQDGLYWKYLDSTTGKLQSGWVEVNNKWYLLNADGTMLIGWQYTNGKWYYLNPVNGDMSIGWKRITLDRHYVVPDITTTYEGSWFYFFPDGSLATNTTIDGIDIGTDGSILN